MYISGIGASGIAPAASKAQLSEPDIRLVFLAESGDTRYEKYSVLRSIHVADEVEARKNNASE